MSLSEVHEFTIKRLSTTQDAVGGQVRSYSTANRGPRPSKIKGRAIVMNEKERSEHGVRGRTIGWKILIFGTNPEVDLTDQITFDYTTGQSHTVEVLVPSLARSHDARFWKIMGQEKTTD
jgi:hypothetical protein